MNPLILSEIKLEKDTRKANILERDNKGNPTKFKQSEFTCKLIFINESGEKFYYVPHFNPLAYSLRLLCKNEDYKYPRGLGRNMLFNSYIFPLWEKYLLRNNFKINEEELIKSQEMAKKIDLEYYNFIKKIREDDNKY